MKDNLSHVSTYAIIKKKKLYSRLPVLDDILESLAKTNAKAKGPKCPSSNRDKDVSRKKKTYYEMRESSILGHHLNPIRSILG